MSKTSRTFVTLVSSVASAGILLASANALAQKVLLNASFDPTREFYAEFNEAFTKHWKETTGEAVAVRQSHGGSGKQARAVIDGLQADVVTLALAYDIDQIAQRTDLLPRVWQSNLPDQSSPYTSTIVFLVRKGNPKGIKDWEDLARHGVSVITSNPKTSGGARWNHLAAYGAILKKEKSEQKALDYLRKLYKNVPVLDSGARGATTTFVQRGIGDVLLTWENEAYAALKETGGRGVEIVVPSVSILAEPPVALVTRNAEKNKTERQAKAYLDFLYSEAGQQIAAKHFFRPRNPSIAAKYAGVFRPVPLFTLKEVYGTWEKAHGAHFSDKGIFDQVYAAGK